MEPALRRNPPSWSGLQQILQPINCIKNCLRFYRGIIMFIHAEVHTNEVRLFRSRASVCDCYTSTYIRLYQILTHYSLYLRLMLRSLSLLY